MQSASQAAAFYREVVERGAVWTIRDKDGFPAPLNADGARAQPFWSSRARVERVISTIEAYQGFDPVEIQLDTFVAKWVPGLTKDGILAGINWTGDRAIGYDMEPMVVAECIAHAGLVGP